MVFAETRDKLLPRPWAVDDLDALLQHWKAAQPYHKALLFVDNAGSDVVLGERQLTLFTPTASAACARGAPSRSLKIAGQ